jgi:uncharacterized OB-fold protein
LSAPEPVGGARVPVRAGLFVDADPPALVCGRCPSCTAHHFPRQATCPYCSGDGVDEALVEGPGRLWAYTAVTAPPPGYGGEVPYGFGVVELSEGMRVVTRLTEGDPARLRPGQEMHLVIVPLGPDDAGRDVVTYAFAPEP